LPFAGFQSLKVLSLESRRALEMARLIENFGGSALSAPAMREVTLAHNSQALEFARGLVAGQFDQVVFLTGVGTRALLQILSEAQLDQPFLEALRRMKVAARGPKPLAVLREFSVPVAVTAPEPCTWKELLVALEGKASLHGQRLAVQAYGVSNPDLLNALRERGAVVTEVAVYRWDLPLDAEPLRSAIGALIAGQVDVALFTTSVQVSHLFRIAEDLKQQDALRAAFQRVVVASIGPDTSEALQRFGLTVDLEPSHPKMGILVKEAADQAADLLAQKRQNSVATNSLGSPL
jgi:uroporphyrinogen-III synthase